MSAAISAGDTITTAFGVGVVTTIGVTLYFVTSSDSGSYVDDTLSAQGVCCTCACAAPVLSIATNVWSLVADVSLGLCAGERDWCLLVLIE